MKWQKFHSKKILAHIPFSTAFLPLAMEVVQKGAQGFGYHDHEAEGLVLAVRELFSFYKRHAAGGSAVEIEMEDQYYRLLLTISFRMANPDLRAFNLTWHPGRESNESPDMFGPMIAARTVSSLRIDFGTDEKVILRLSRDRNYTPAQPVALPPPDTLQTLRVADPSRDDLHHFATMAVTSGSRFLPPFLARPGMVADMLDTGHINALLLLGDDWIMGGILWKPLSDSCLELFGPYVFIDDPEERAMSLLLDEAVTRISRSRFRGLVRRQGPLADHERFFDFLGEIRLTGVDGAASHATYYYRQLKEEPGKVVYSSGQLAEFLSEQYERLCFPRQLRTASKNQALSRNSSVLAVELEHARSLAIIRPLCAGRDMSTNLASHLELLRNEGIINFIVEINTDRSEESAFTEALNTNGFVPRLIIPDAAHGDLVIYDLCRRETQP